MVWRRIGLPPDPAVSEASVHRSQEVERADRAERERDALRRDLERLRRENERLREELDVARRARSPAIWI